LKTCCWVGAPAFLNTPRQRSWWWKRKAWRRWWFLNGAPLGDSANQDSINASFEQLGRYQLSVLDEAGQTARVEFSVVD
jgi:membrane carboxypeptidase/penicillin-binding protein PbpC